MCQSFFEHVRALIKKHKAALKGRGSGVSKQRLAQPTHQLQHAGRRLAPTAPLLVLSNGVKMPALCFGLGRLAGNPRAEQLIRVALDAGYRCFDTSMLYDGTEAALGKAWRAVQALHAQSSSSRQNCSRGTMTPSILQRISVPNLAASTASLGNSSRACRLTTLTFTCSTSRMCTSHSSGKCGRDSKLCMPKERSAHSVSRMQTSRQSRPFTSAPSLSNPSTGRARCLSIYSHAVGALGNGFPAHRHTENASLLAFARAHGVTSAAFNTVSAHESHSTILSAISDPHVLAIAAEQRASPVAVMFAWALQQGYCVLLGSSSEEHIRSNLQLANLKLRDEQMDRLSALITLAESGIETHRPAFAADRYGLFGGASPPVDTTAIAIPAAPAVTHTPALSSFHADGFMVVKDALPPETVASLRRVALEFAKRPGVTLLGAKDAGGVSGLAVPDLLASSHAGAVQPLLEVLMASAAVRRALELAFNGSEYSFTGMCDLQFNRSVHWHRDLLHPPRMQLEKHDVWTGARKEPVAAKRPKMAFAKTSQRGLAPNPGDIYRIYRLVVYLESHINDDKALSVLPGSHLERGCKLPCGKGGRGYLESPKGLFKKVKPVVLRPGVGDALLFDQRLIPRGQTFQGADQESRIAVQISFGLPNAFTYEFSEGARQRQRDQALSGKGSMPAGGLKLELRRACDAPSKAVHQQGADTLPKGVKPLHPRSFMCFPSGELAWPGSVQSAGSAGPGATAVGHAAFVRVAPAASFVCGCRAESRSPKSGVESRARIRK